jgi:tetratricopeptide (TPR) repeat protein
MLRRLGSCLLVVLALLLPCALGAQLQQFGRIIGQVRIARGDVPPHQILIELQHRGAAMDDVYADAQGHFGFLNLPGGEYHVIINDEAFYPVDERVNVNPDVNPYTMVQIALRPREEKKKDDPMGARPSGSSPYLVDPADYNKRFPKKALKEYERAVNAEHKGNHDEAIAHYLSALKIAPEYYPAHNNLGSLYLGKADFKSAEEQFQETVRLDQNDAQAYFNLGNVFLLKGQFTQAEAAVSSGLQRRPDSAFGHFLQGCLDVRTGKLPEAEKSLRSALQLDATMWQAHLQLVSLYLQQQQRQQAITELQAFLKAFPSVPAVPKAKDLLYRLQNESDPSHRPE